MDINTDSDKSFAQIDNTIPSDFKKYMPVSEMDSKWGLVINDLGVTTIDKTSDYPPKGHPGSHMFSWETGRILQEYHFVFITKGEGVFESKTAGTVNINCGDGFLLYPNEWHRYKPNRATGWKEHWIGFSGQIADIVMNTGFFNRKNAVIHSCSNMLVLSLFNAMFQLINEEPMGYQRTVSGICLQLLAELSNIRMGLDSKKGANSVVSKAKYLMHKQIDEKINLHAFCKDNKISYSKFRLDFKTQTGFSPLQYFLHLKIEKSKMLFNNTDLRAKEIAYQLGFKSEHYFSRIFKQKTGYSPQQFRKKGRDEGV